MPALDIFVSIYHNGKGKLGGKKGKGNTLSHSLLPPSSVREERGGEKDSPWHIPQLNGKRGKNLGKKRGESKERSCIFWRGGEGGKKKGEGFVWYLIPHPRKENRERRPDHERENPLPFLSREEIILKKGLPMEKQYNSFLSLGGGGSRGKGGKNCGSFPLTRREGG